MKTTVFTCDKCNQSVAESDLRELNVIIKGKPRGESHLSVDYITREVQKDVCLNCLKKSSIVGDKFIIDDNTKIENTKTLESKLLEILEDLEVHFQY